MFVFTRQEVPFSKCEEAIEPLQLTLWPLADFRSGQEVRESMSSEPFPLVLGGSIFGIVFEVHFSVMDKTGDAIVIEYTEKRKQVYNNILGVMTNASP